MKNNYFVLNDIAYIELNRKDDSILHAIVDKDDLEIVDSYNGKWYADWNKGTKSFYCKINILTANGKYTTKRLHRVIMNCPDRLQVDHVNHNTLDNRKCNLRIVTPQENTFNQRCKGYSWFNRDKKWKAYIKINGKLKQKHLGYFDNEEDARNAYLEAKAKYHIIEKR